MIAGNRQTVKHVKSSCSLFFVVRAGDFYFRVPRLNAARKSGASVSGRAASHRFSKLLEDSKNQREHTNRNRENDRQFLKFRFAARRFAFVGKGRGFAAEGSAHAGTFRLLHQYDDDEQDRDNHKRDPNDGRHDFH